MTLDERTTKVLEFISQTMTIDDLLRDPGQTIGNPMDTESGQLIAPRMDVFERTRAVDAIVANQGFAVDDVELGRGGMGVVRLGQQRRLARRVAVKSLSAVARNDAVARRRLIQEALITGALEHPGIVPVHDIDVDHNGAPLVALKRLEGTAWSALLHDEAAAKARGAADLLEGNLRVLIAVCDALHYAHHRGIIHRDVKPDNIMIGAFGEVTLLDWGLAVAVGEGAARLPHVPRPDDTNTVVGTPAYMPPELLERDVSAQGPATDVYLLGAVLYEILSGSPPHRAPDLPSLLVSVLRGPPPLPATAPPVLVELTTRCMARSPRDRPASCHDVKRVLLDFLVHRAAEAIGAAAREATEALEARVQAPAADDDLTTAIALFAQARFGFHQMKAAGGDPEAASRGVERAAEAAITLALRAGSPDTAQVFVTTAGPLPASLAQRVVDAREQARASAAKWRAAADDANLQIGKTARLRLMIVLGILASCISVALHVSIQAGRQPSHVVGVAWLTGVAVVGSIGYLVMRRRFRNEITRRFLLTLLAGIITVIISRLCFWRLGLSPEMTDILAMHEWWGVITAVAMAMERRLLPSVALNGVGLLLVLRWPELRNLIGAVEYAFFFANAYWAWRTRPAEDDAGSLRTTS